MHTSSISSWKLVKARNGPYLNLLLYLSRGVNRKKKSRLPPFQTKSPTNNPSDTTLSTNDERRPSWLIWESMFIQIANKRLIFPPKVLLVNWSIGYNVLRFYALLPLDPLRYFLICRPPVWFIPFSESDEESPCCFYVHSLTVLWWWWYHIQVISFWGHHLRTGAHSLTCVLN